MKLSRIFPWRLRRNRHPGGWVGNIGKRGEDAILVKIPGPGPRDLTDEEMETIGRDAKCPFCQRGLLVGPQGGLCTNLFCESSECRARFNYCIYTGQYMGRESAEFYDQMVDWA